MQHSIHTNQFEALPQYGQTFDNPERMLFYAMVGGILTWSVIGVCGWAIWKLIG